MIRVFSGLLCAVLLLPTCSLRADDTRDAMRERAIAFLTARQNDDGSWTHPTAVGITGLVTAALLDSGVPAESPPLAKALQQLQSNIRPDGGIFDASSLHRNYDTCIAIMAFSQANADGRYDQTIANAHQFLAKLQWDEGEGVESSDPAWGGAGYGRHQRPDMCNSEFLIEALKAAGVQDDDPEMQRVLTFVSRCQNLESPHNDSEFAPLINDGGFYYTVAAGGDSKAGTEPNGGLRSYGSMTYAGLKSLIYAGLEPDDPRVEAATEWIRRHYTLDENPGMGAQGLFYYFHTFAKAMNAIGGAEFVDAAGEVHDWRAQLTARLRDLQQPNGSWTNPADRWKEGDPHLVTAYCLMALNHCDSSPSKESDNSGDSGGE